MNVEKTIEIREEGNRIVSVYTEVTGKEAIFLIANRLPHEELARVIDGLMNLYISQSERIRAEKKKAKREQRKARQA